MLSSHWPEYSYLHLLATGTVRIFKTRKHQSRFDVVANFTRKHQSRFDITGMLTCKHSTRYDIVGVLTRKHQTLLEIWTPERVTN